MTQSANAAAKQPVPARAPGGKPPKTIEELITSDAGKKNLSAALPKHLTVDKFVRVALTAFNRTPKLRECTIESLWGCLLDLSQIGLEPNGRDVHLVPYGRQCTLIVDYKGLVKLARRSGEVSYIHADVVCERDEFAYQYGTGAFLKHVPTPRDRGKTVMVYSFVKLRDGSEDFMVMNFEEVERIRERSKAKDSGPWMTDRQEMEKKTVFRRHSKWLPMSSEFQAAIEKDFDKPAEDLPAIDIANDMMPKAKENGKEASAKPAEPAGVNMPASAIETEATSREPGQDG